MHEGGVRRHDDGRERGKVASLRRRRNMLHWVRGLVIREDLIDAENNVGKEQRALYGISAPTANAPGAQDNCACNGDPDQSGIHVGDLRELKNTPEEVDRAGDDSGRKDQKTDLSTELVRVATHRRL